MERRASPMELYMNNSKSYVQEDIVKRVEVYYKK